MYDVIIIGGGPAGVAAGIYCARKNLKVILLTKDLEGQIFDSPKVENYPGFKEISGINLSAKLKEHLLNFSSNIEIKEGFFVKKIERIEDNNFQIATEDGKKFISKVIIIASGASPRKLDVPGAKEFEGKGVSFCETCDGPFLKEKDVVVVGSGNAGLEAAEELASYTNKVCVLEIKNKLVGDEFLAKRLEKKGNVEIIFNVELKKIKGENFVEKIIYFDKKEGQEKQLNVSGIFVKVGQFPNSDFAEDSLEINERKEIIINPKTLETSEEGIFAAGDVTDISYKQYIIAAGEGAKAALSAYNYLKNKK
ncbi:MAG: FAD-dependent oxidoreductase [Candidatus Pacebacteria bacterium]|nr:FAD-dependent oxidoreductase [Candidatus Paceibacterota bacterium]